MTGIGILSMRFQNQILSNTILDYSSPKFQDKCDFQHFFAKLSGKHISPERIVIPNVVHSFFSIHLGKGSKIKLIIFP